MTKQTGIHFYIAIVNFNDIILDEETKTGRVTHAIHALDTFFTSIEVFGKRLSQKLVVEKITGSRLHLYVVEEINAAFSVVKAVSSYAFLLSKFFTTGIPKYKNLKRFEVNAGVAYGEFYDFEFSITEGLSELTTIGYVANFAAKLQALSGMDTISISEDIYNSLSSAERKRFEKIKEPSIAKYNQTYYYTMNLACIDSPVSITDLDFISAKDYANSANLGDIDFAGVRGLLDFRRLSKTQCKKLEGIPVFADIRGFTCQFEEDDSNLEEMAQRTQQILETMYRVSTEYGGIHVQFQGDRELSLYHNIPAQMVDGVHQAEQKCFRSAVLASMRMIDAVKPYTIHVGIGEDFGILFATKIGARGEKDNILLGETVIHADFLEDTLAGEDQIVISNRVYEGLLIEDAYLANQFSKLGDCFVATIGFQQYKRNVSSQMQRSNTAQNKYNGAWGDAL